jgi:hypothetical protein
MNTIAIKSAMAEIDAATSAMSHYPDTDTTASAALLRATTARAFLRDALEEISPMNKQTAAPNDSHYRFGADLVPPFDVSLQINVDGLTVDKFKEDSPRVMARLSQFVIEAIGTTGT